MVAGTESTLRDVADAAGVSPMTVSRVLNHPGMVREKTKKRVLKAIKALDYTPNMAARRLSRAQFIQIAILMDDLNASFMNAMLVACFRSVGEQHVQIIIEDVRSSGDAVSAAKKLLASRVHGVILAPPLCENMEVIDFLSAAGIPTVALTATDPSVSTSALHIDDELAASTMTRHIVALGHTKIGFIGGKMKLAAARQRLAGFRHALNAEGILIREEWIQEGDFTYLSGLAAAEELLEQPDRPTAIFACNDDMAAAVVAVAHRLGLDVPADVTVCGFDDTNIATAIWPQLTTVRQPIAQMTSDAIELLIRSDRGRDDVTTRRVYDFTLVRRQTDATPRRKDKPPVTLRAVPHGDASSRARA